MSPSLQERQHRALRDDSANSGGEVEPIMAFEGKDSTSPGFCFTRLAGRTHHLQRRGILRRFISKREQKTGSHPTEKSDEPFSDKL